MRAVAWFSLVYFLFFSVLTWIRPLAPQKRLWAAVLGVAGLVCTSAVLLAETILPSRSAVLVRDWLPVGMMLLAYRQGGHFFTRPNARLQGWLERLDERWLGRVLPYFTRPSPAGTYLETAYLACYWMIPSALAVLYVGNARDAVEEFWSVVLPAGFVCYGMVPFFQTLPPRAKEEEQRFGSAPGILRRVNLGVLSHGSIRANTFPSAHVAAPLAASLVVLRHVPAGGAVLLWLSLSIAVAAVLRRYHFALDVLAGAAVAAAFLLLVGLR